jgi:glutamyl-tRNA reductase
MRRSRQLADAELARLHHRLPGLSDKQRAETAATVHRILRKALHRPTVRAKELSTGPHGPAYLEALRRLFDLPIAPAPEHGAPRARLSVLPGDHDACPPAAARYAGGASSASNPDR